ncbi:MAG: SDR family oxidoreductase [Elusimicrobia bacterium]|nr:SDR family oxidoreductase [Elusimicrobiota bacterium]
MKDFKGKTAVISGGARGLGLAVGARLARAGAQVALWDINEKGLQRAVEALRATGSLARGYALDAADPAQVREMAARVRAELGEVDILDNNAGVVFPGDFLDFTEEQLNKTVDVNLKSYLWCTRAFLPAMISRGSGHVVMTASAAGMTGVPGLAAYSASKHAVIGLAESLRLELLRNGVRGVGMTIVCPSFIATGMFEGVRPPAGAGWLTADHVADKVVEAIASGKLYVREPFLVKLLPLLKAMPSVRWMDWLGEVMGMHRSTENFGKKTITK